MRAGSPTSRARKVVPAPECPFTLVALEQVQTPGGQCDAFHFLAGVLIPTSPILPGEDLRDSGAASGNLCRGMFWRDGGRGGALQRAKARQLEAKQLVGETLSTPKQLFCALEDGGTGTEKAGAVYCLP